jgi:hypothetical protein
MREARFTGASDNGPIARSSRTSRLPPRSAVNMARCCSFMMTRTMADTSGFAECSV